MQQQQRINFTHKLEELRMHVVRMAALAEKAVRHSVCAYLDADADQAGTVVMGDAEINDMEDSIDSFTLELLALDQPMASDLRFIVGVMRLTTNLERIGDEAVNLGHRTLFLSRRPPIAKNPHMEQLGVYVTEMLSRAVRSFVDQDTALAAEVCRMDDRADELSIKVLKESISTMVDESRIVERGVHVIMASRHMERIGDLATNLAEVVIFIKEGQNIKHHYKG